MADLAGLTEEQMNRLEKARHRVIESIGANMDLYGVTLSIGHLYGYMYFQEHPATLDQMGEKMGMSKTSMSTGMRTLMDLKMVNKVWEKGTRKDLYEVVPDWYQTFVDFFSNKWRRAVEANTGAMRKLVKVLKEIQAEIGEVNPETCRAIDREIARIDDALQYYDWLERLIDSMETGKIFEYIPKKNPETE